MQITLVMLIALFSSQVEAPTGDRYPQQSSEATTDPTLGSDSNDAPPVETNIFDQIDAAAAPLSTSSESTADPPGTTQSPLQEDYQSTQSAPPRETSPPVSETDPANLLALFLTAPTENQLQGTSLSLAKAIDGSLSRAEQTQRIDAYWELSQAVANYYLTYKERAELITLRQGITQPNADWTTAQQAADARLQLALDRVHVNQEYLAQLMGNTTPGFSPLPSDVPYCGRYETRYTQIFQSRSSALAKSLNDLLPRAHEDLETRAEEIDQARQWMFRTSDNRSPQSDGQELLKAYELYAARRRTFLGAVKEYNRAILRYTEIATPGALDTERLVAMLIRTGSSPESTFDTEVQRANAEEAASPKDSSSTQPQNSAPGGWNSTRQSNTERSILVPRS